MRRINRNYLGLSLNQKASPVDKLFAHATLNAMPRKQVVRPHSWRDIGLRKVFNHPESSSPVEEKQ